MKPCEMHPCFSKFSRKLRKDSLTYLFRDCNNSTEIEDFSAEIVGRWMLEIRGENV